MPAPSAERLYDRALQRRREAGRLTSKARYWRARGLLTEAAYQWYLAQDREAVAAVTAARNRLRQETDLRLARRPATMLQPVTFSATGDGQARRAPMRLVDEAEDEW